MTEVGVKVSFKIEVRGKSQVLGSFYLVNEDRKRNLCNAIVDRGK